MTPLKRLLSYDLALSAFRWHALLPPRSLLKALPRGAGLLDASPKVQASAVTVLSQALSVPGLGAETRAALLVSHCSSSA